MSKFVHLHTHSHYSLLSALPKVDQLVDEAKKDGMTSLAITDNGNLYSAVEFYKDCQKAEIKPIIGVDFYVALRSRKDMQAGIDNRRTRLVMLAMNDIGYKNLIKLVTDSNLEGFYYKPRIDRELIEKYNEGLICIQPSFGGEIVQSLKSRSQDKAKEVAAFYKKIFGGNGGSDMTNGGNRLFIEITRHPEIEGHEASMKTLISFARQEGIPLMAAQDVYYIKPDDRLAREILMKVNSHTDASDRVSDSDEDDFSFITPERAEELFADLPEAIENTAKIAEACNVEIRLGAWFFPDFKVESGRTPDDELRHMVYEGFAKHNLVQTDELIKRAEYELGVIKKKGYAPYFLVVGDMLRFARENNIFSNIRGSVSGSLVTYLIDITKINPIEYEIGFERFLNPDRPSPPDIDMDYADDRRDEVISYVRRKYGNDKVAQIGTFGTMAARGAVRDVARAMGFPYDVGDRISKLIPMGSQGFPMTIDRALLDVPELKTAYNDEPDTRRIIDMAKKIEGCARQLGVHAAGVVISPTALTDFTPIQFDPKGENKIITQYDMYSIEDAGLLKYDFLGLKNLTIIADAVARIEKIDGVKIDTDNIPIDDKETFEMLARGETADLFQLNGDGMTHFLKELKPSTIHDINAMVALYRPGPIQFIPQYIERKHDPSLIKYPDAALGRILAKTYGILVYQDDLLTMAHELAGYSWMEVDKFRKAVGKKIPEEMAKQKEKFIKGCMEHSQWKEKKAQSIWKWIEPFAAYGFNKAHSISYGRVSYITAYLKAHFPEMYLSAVLTSEQGETDKVASTIAECKRIGIKVLPPDINESFSQFTVVKGDSHPYHIRFGLVTIKNFGQGISTTIIEERKQGGPFKSLADFLERVKDRNLNKKSLESLIKAGAMDCFGQDRGVMLANIDLMLEYHKEGANKQKDQDSLFGGMSKEAGVPDLRLLPAAPVEATERLAWEKELLGLYISGHPLDKYRNIIEKKDLDIKKALETKKDGESVILCVIITTVRPIQTKKNETMAFITISDFSGSSEAVVFPRTYREFAGLISSDKCLAVKATVNTRNGERSFVIERMKGL
jgi:DNA polymerase-3 subunit alpha